MKDTLWPYVRLVWYPILFQSTYDQCGIEQSAFRQWFLLQSDIRVWLELMYFFFFFRCTPGCIALIPELLAEMKMY